MMQRRGEHNKRLAEIVVALSLAVDEGGLC